MTWPLVGLSLLVSFAGSLLVAALVIALERKRRPKLSFAPGEAWEKPTASGPRAKWLRAQVRNEALPRWIAWLVTRSTAYACRASITFQHFPDRRDVFGRSMEGRWANTPEPWVPASPETIVLDPARFARDVDIPPGEMELLDVLIVFEGADRFYGWCNESYYYNWKHPAWELPNGRYVAHVTVSTGGLQFSADFEIAGEGRYEDVRLVPVPLPREKREVLQ